MTVRPTISFSRKLEALNISDAADIVDGEITELASEMIRDPDASFKLEVRWNGELTIG
jgi:hypothetical protein